MKGVEFRPVLPISETLTNYNFYFSIPESLKHTSRFLKVFYLKKTVLRENAPGIGAAPQVVLLLQRQDGTGAKPGRPRAGAPPLKGEKLRGNQGNDIEKADEGEVAYSGDKGSAFDLLFLKKEDLLAD